MSIESKHAYRFGYLKSEQWQNVRLEALVREKAKCQICKEESISNDAHHVWYPENIYETTQRHLVVLCRDCHEFVHAMLPECKTRDEEAGMELWVKFKNAITAWRFSKSDLFTKEFLFSSDMLAGSPKAIREQLAKVSKELKDFKFNPQEKLVIPVKPSHEIKAVMEIVRKWASAYEHSSSHGNLSVAQDDFQI